MSKTLTLLVLAGALALGACNGQERTTPPSDSLEDQAAFILGHDIGANIHHQIEDLGFTEDAVMAGFRAGLRGDSLELSQQQVDSIMVAFQTQVMDRMVTSNRADGEAFLADFDQQPDVVTTDTGLRYRVLEDGEGATPGPDDVVTLHYEGRLPDGEVFDSSHRRGQPATFPVQGVVPGFSEALQLMQAGGKYEIVLPPELGYGDQAPPAIGPGQTLIFTVDLLEIGARQ
jgi:FKBP-type peptidyl-prolyl cis-trans isomerase FklB